MEVAAELVVVGGEEEEEEGMVGACDTISRSSTVSFRVTAAAEVEADDLGRLFWGEGTRKNKKRRKEGREEGEVRVPRFLLFSRSSTASFRVAVAAKVEAADLGKHFWGEGTRKKKKKRRKEGKEEDEVRVPKFLLLFKTLILNNFTIKKILIRVILINSSSKLSLFHNLSLQLCNFSLLPSSITGRFHLPLRPSSSCSLPSPAILFPLSLLLPGHPSLFLFFNSFFGRSRHLNFLPCKLRRYDVGA